MADKKIILEVELLEGDAQSKLNVLNASLKNLDKTHKDYKPTLELIKKAERELSKIQEKRILVENRLATSTGKVDEATKKTSKQMKQLSSDTGASTAATLELGRVFSDAPYGIRGVANNIQQLASNLFFMSKKTNVATGKTVGFSGAIGSLLKNLIGPAGILVAFQAGIALLDYFQGGMGKAKKSLDGFRVSAAGAASDLTSLLIVIKEDMLSKEELSSVIDKVNEKYKDLNLSIGEEGELTKESITQIDNKITALGKLALANAMLSEIQNKRGETAKAAVELQEETSEDLKKLGLASIADFRDIEVQRTDETKREYIKRKNLLLSTQEGTYKGLVDVDRIGRFNRIKRQVADFDETKERVSNQVKELLKLSTDEGFFEDFFNSKEKKKDTKKTPKISLLKTPKEFEGDLFEIEDMLRKFSGKELLRNAKTEEEKNTAKAIIELEGFKKSFQDFRLSEDEKLVEFKKSLEKKRLAQIASAKGDKKRISEINAIFDKTSLDAQETYELESTISYNNYIAGLKAIVDKNKPDLILGELGKTELDRDKLTRDAKQKHFEFMLEKHMKYAEQAMEVLGGIGDFINGEFDREMVMEQNKTNLLNNELNKRLANENLSKDGRQAIQDEIARNDEKLRVKQEVIEKKRFKMQKAMDMGMAIMETAVAIMKALSTYGPTPVGFATAGLAAAMGAIQVATIARQKFQTSSSSSPRAAGGSNGGGGSERAEPSFNIVGRSDDNLLINAIQATFDKPLKAYVVARDVTNQQQLDGIITDKAGT